MFYLVGILIALASLSEAKSYTNQIHKTVICNSAKDVSLKAYRAKLLKQVFTISALLLSQNYVGLIIEGFALSLCLYTYVTIRRYRCYEYSK